MKHHDMSIKNGMRPVHPGEVLREDYLLPLGLSANALAKRLHIPASRINDIVLERPGVRADSALRLVHFLAAILEVGSTCKFNTTCAWPSWTRLPRLRVRSSPWRFDACKG